jgi:hypothetical protein
LFLLGVPGQSPRTPDFKEKKCRAATPFTLARGTDAARPRPAIPLAGSRGSVYDGPTGEAGRAI